MASIQIRAREHQTAADIFASYAAARAALWPKQPQPRPIFGRKPEPVPVQAPPPPPVIHMGDDDYAKFLAKIFKPDPPAFKLNRAGLVCRTVAVYYEITVEQMMMRNRRPQFLRARETTIYILNKGLGFSLPKTGRIMGGRDHTTILWSLRKAIKRVQDDPQHAARITSLMHACGLVQA